MSFSFFIARRYFLTSAKKNLIHRMGLIACFSVALSTMALLLVLSVFNGLEDLIQSLFRSFDPDIKIELKQGKSFVLNPEIRHQIDAIPGIAKVVDVIEDNALFCYQERQLVARLKGVTDSFVQQSPLAAFVEQGSFKLKQDNKYFALIGKGIQYALSISLANEFQDLQVFYPQRIQSSISMPHQLYSSKYIRPGAVFAVEKHFDENYVIVPLAFAAMLMGMGDKRTALEVQVANGFSVEKIQHMLKKCLPKHFQVLNSNEQHAPLMRAIRIERLFVRLTLSFILLVSSLNIFFILSMLVLDKRKDIAILYTLGAEPKAIRYIFLIVSLLIGLSGAVLGMAVAWLLSWLQETFGLISLGMQTSLIEAYPVRRQVSDFVYAALSVVVITLIATYRPAQLSAKTAIRDNIIVE
ncbi:MAG: FtsX-like permease family protein [Bacteroidota bacterium]